MPDPIGRRLKTAKGFRCTISEKTDTVFGAINTGNVAKRLERAGLLRALRIERNRPVRPQREN
jgi:hypothetical protein